MIEINPDRLITNLRTLATFGADAGGLHRTAFSEADMRARQWLAQRFEAAGLRAAIDALGNVYGHDPAAERTILIGSHTDTVPGGGWLDGALGVIYGLEVACALHDRAGAGPVGIDVIDFQDEEGTISPFLGSRAFCGMLSETDALALVPSHATTARTTDAPTIHHFEQGRHLAYLEAHIEQGPKLEAAQRTVGIVQGIVGIHRFRARALGQADHAGTTPMPMRRDAARSLFALMEQVYREFPRIAGAETVWNIGSISFQPGAANVVPQQAEMMIEIRDIDAAVLDTLEQSLRARVETHNSADAVPIEIERTYCTPPVPMAQDIAALIEAAARRLRQTTLSLPSGAGHDAMIVANVMPAGMMFIPSIGGRSHSPLEDTSETDIVAGCRVFAAAIGALMTRYVR